MVDFRSKKSIAFEDGLFAWLKIKLLNGHYYSSISTIRV